MVLATGLACRELSVSSTSVVVVVVGTLIVKEKGRMTRQI